MTDWVYIRIRSDEFYRVSMRFPGREEPLTFSSLATSAEIANFRRKYFGEIVAARRKLGSANPYSNPKNALRFFDHIDRLGSEYLWKLAGERELDVIREFRKAFSKQVSSFDPKNRSIPIIIDAPDLFVPLEIVPMFDIEGSEERKTEILPEEQEALMHRRARQFAGMVGTIHRIRPQEALSDGEAAGLAPEPQPREVGRIDQADLLAARSRLPVKLFYHCDLKGAKDEASFFAERPDVIDLDGPWPFAVPRLSMAGRIASSWQSVWRGIGFGKDRPEDQQDREEAALQAFASVLAGHIRCTDLRLDGSSRDPEDQVQHFSCHCGRTSDGGDYEISLKAVNGAVMTVRTGEIGRNFKRYARNPSIEGEAIASGPLVFLNACETGVGEAGDFGSFEQLFPLSFNRALITSQTVVPDTFAAEFSSIFYDSILPGQMTVGQALHIARWEMLRSRQNPFGILYSLSGNANLVVGDPAKHLT